MALKGARAQGLGIIGLDALLFTGRDDPQDEALDYDFIMISHGLV